MKVSIPLITNTMKVLESYDYSTVKKTLSNNYDNNDDIESIIEELKRFLALKVFEKDFNADILTPSHIIDEAWHSLILDPLSYTLLCQQLSNNKSDPKEYIINHNQHGGDDIKNNKKRYEKTLMLYKEYFGQAPPLMIWPTNSTINRITPMKERKRLRTSATETLSKSNSFGCQVDADLDDFEYGYEELPWLAVSLAWQETDSKYELNGDVLKTTESKDMEYIELFIKTHAECDYLIKVLSTTSILAIHELICRLLNTVAADSNIGMQLTNKRLGNFNINSFNISFKGNLLNKQKLCENYDFHNGDILEVLLVYLGC